MGMQFEVKGERNASQQTWRRLVFIGHVLCLHMGEVGDTSSNSICTQAIKVHLTLHKIHKKDYLKCSVMHTSLELAMSFS